MKSSLSNILHRTPWWALLLGAVASIIVLAFFVTPYHIIQYRHGGDPLAAQAIKREIDNTFAEQAINLASGVVRGMREATKDPERRAEFDEALAGLAEARSELREAGAEVLRSKRDALEAMTGASERVVDAVRDARREAERALKEGGVDNPEARKSLEDSLRAAEEAEREARKALRAEARGDARSEARGGGASVRIDGSADNPKIEIMPRGGPGIRIEGDPAGPKIEIQVPPPPAPPGSAAPPVPGAVIAPPLPPVPLAPEVRQRIQKDVMGDIYRIGIGAILAVILVPMFILAVVAKFFIDRSRTAQRQAELKRKEADYHRMSQQVTEAKLAALQAQVEPHFLYNTLASVQALTEVDPAQANVMTGHLIQYLRNALPKMRGSVSTVGQEIELVRAFLNILQMRMGKRLTFEIAVPQELEALEFPPLMLPSLVENAIKHGLEPQREGGHVRISAERVEGKLRMVCADTGRGFGETVGNGVGLTNIRERLAALYGDAARLTMEANEPHGVIATLEIPADGARVGVTPDAAGAMGAAEAGDATVPPGRIDPTFSDAASGAAPRAIPAEPPAAPTWSQRTLEVMGVAERVWRKALWYVFLGLVIIAAVACGAGYIGILAGIVPVEMAGETISGPGSAMIGVAVALIVFFVAVLALAIVVAVIYGLGFLMVGLAIFIPIVVIVAMSPVIAPLALVGLIVWWAIRRKKDEPAVATPK